MNPLILIVKVKNDFNSSNIGNAFLVLSNSATYHHKLAYQGIYFDADKQFSYKWNDPMFDIK